MTEPIQDPINKIGVNYVGVDKDTVLEKGDIITFVFVADGSEMENITGNNLMGLIDRVEDRYVTISFSHTPIKDGEISYVSLDRIMVVKMNGHARVSWVGPNGVTASQLPLADVVNQSPSVVVKNMMERKK